MLPSDKTELDSFLSNLAMSRKLVGMSEIQISHVFEIRKPSPGVEFLFFSTAIYQGWTNVVSRLINNPDVQAAVSSDLLTEFLETKLVKDEDIKLILMKSESLMARLTPENVNLLIAEAFLTPDNFELHCLLGNRVVLRQVSLPLILPHYIDNLKDRNFGVNEFKTILLRHLNYPQTALSPKQWMSIIGKTFRYRLDALLEALLSFPKLMHHAPESMIISRYFSNAATSMRLPLFKAFLENPVLLRALQEYQMIQTIRKLEFVVTSQPALATWATVQSANMATDKILTLLGILASDPERFLVSTEWPLVLDSLLSFKNAGIPRLILANPVLRSYLSLNARIAFMAQIEFLVVSREQLGYDHLKFLKSPTVWPEGAKEVFPFMDWDKLEKVSRRYKGTPNDIRDVQFPENIPAAQLYNSKLADLAEERKSQDANISQNEAGKKGSGVATSALRNPRGQPHGLPANVRVARLHGLPRPYGLRPRVPLKSFHLPV